MNISISTVERSIKRVCKLGSSFKSVDKDLSCRYMYVCTRDGSMHKRRNIIQFYSETTHLYAFVWLNLSLSCVSVSFCSFPYSKTRRGLFLCAGHHPIQFNPNAVSCFNFHSLHKTERRVPAVSSRVTSLSLFFSNFIYPSLSFWSPFFFPINVFSIQISVIYILWWWWWSLNSRSRCVTIGRIMKREITTYSKERHLLCHQDI